MNFNRYKFFVSVPAALLVTVTLIAILSCKKDESKTAVAVFITGTVSYQSDGSQVKKPLELNYVLKKRDTIITGSGSEVTIQIGATAILTVVQNTSVSLESIVESGKTELFLNAGTVLNRVSKLQKEDEYSIRTKTALAAVRGTEFLVIAEKGRSTVAVNSGAVDVTRIESNEKKSIIKDNKAIIDATYRIEPLNSLDRLYFEKLSLMPVMDVIALTNEEKSKEAYNGVKDKSAEIDKKIQELSPMPLSEIRKKYNRIDIITLYSGKVIEGVIISRGELFSILTPQGLVTVAKKDVKRVNIKK